MDPLGLWNPLRSLFQPVDLKVTQYCLYYQGVWSVASIGVGSTAATSKRPGRVPTRTCCWVVVVQGLGFRVCGSGFRVQGLGFRV